jgi:hypothetical protein
MRTNDSLDRLRVDRRRPRLPGGTPSDDPQKVGCAAGSNRTQERGCSPEAREEPSSWSLFIAIALGALGAYALLAVQASPLVAIAPRHLAVEFDDLATLRHLNEDTACAERS